MADSFDVLLTYSREDSRMVLAVAERMRSSGVRVWMDRLSLVPGQSFEAPMHEALRNSKAIAVFCGSSGLSPFNSMEIQEAQALGLRCIPVVLPGGSLPGELFVYEAIDLTSESDEVLKAQVNRLIAAVGGKPATESPSRIEAAGIAKPGGEERPPMPRSLGNGPAEASSAVQRARDIIRGQAASIPDVQVLVKELKKQKEMGFARQLLARIRADHTTNATPAQKFWLGQQHALCTYKDPHQPNDRKFDQALRILNETDDLLSTKSQETLGLAGAIHKYKWEALGQIPDLEQSATYYLRGYRIGPESDFGYTSINAAYVLDLLASQADSFAQKAGDISTVAEARRAQAREIRQRLIEVLPPLAAQAGNESIGGQWWFLVTVAEAYFGLKEFAGATEWLGRARNAGPEDWEFESTARQLANIARMMAGPAWLTEAVEETPAWKTLGSFLGNAAAVRSAFLGKIGLALSGGGLRASLYHIGVLAKLAELDVLRHIEVLSCVSGGSIIGAHYYLELQNLMESKTDTEISREDYIAIIRRMERDFLLAAQTNIRTRVVSSFVTNVKMLLNPNYSRSERIAELYESEFFSKVGDNKGHQPRCLQHLRMQPKGETPAFAPKDQNWRRRCKVPILILNATTLNTGHNWQFTATYMGEPPGAIDSEVDGNYRLRRLYYSEAPEGYKDMRLGRAVAASAGVPGLFDPISLKGLYPETIVRLVDGGVHDNQGVNALFEQGCSVLLVSDASGQMGTEDTPGNSSLSSLLRSNSIMGSRIRGAEYHDLSARRRSSLIRSLMFIHLKKDLESDPKNWEGCEDPVDASPDDARPAFRRGGLSSYGIRKDVQRLIADIRTDLDSFHEVEAFALMTSAYRMTETEFALSISGLPRAAPIAPDWRFLSIEELMKRSAGMEKAHDELKKLLAISGGNAFKVWRLVPWLFWSGCFLLAALVVGFFLRAFFGPEMELPILRVTAVTLLAAAVTGMVGKWPVAAVQYRSTIRRYLVGVALCAAGWAVGGLHLAVFDRLYLRLGRAERLLSMIPGRRGLK